jgi:hypothetical protein
MLELSLPRTVCFAATFTSILSVPRARIKQNSAIVASVTVGLPAELPICAVQYDAESALLEPIERCDDGLLQGSR